MGISNLCLALFACSSLFLTGPERVSTQGAYQRPVDSVITGRPVMSLAEFELIVRREGAKAGLAPGMIDNVMAEVRRRYTQRILPVSERQYAFLSLLYMNQAPCEIAERFLAGLRASVPCAVDTGFLEAVRSVALSQAARVADQKEVLRPRPIEQPLPPYSEAGREAAVEGTVVMRCVILEDGTVANCRCIRTLGYGLDEAAMLAIQSKWKFEPGLFDGRPVPVEATVEVTYRLY
jgi:TonB family protein